MRIRKRPHRRVDCGTSQKITVAYYLLTQNLPDVEKLDLILSHPNLSGHDRAYSDQRYLFVFTDESVLGFDETNGFYLADMLGRNRPDMGPTAPNGTGDKKIYI